jgi:hypothetical protein
MSAQAFAWESSQAHPFPQFLPDHHINPASVEAFKTKEFQFDVKAVALASKFFTQ